MVVADLHVHTTVSDGRLVPEQVPRAAGLAGLEAVAITDHDRISPWLDAPVVQHDEVTLVNGIELRVVADGLRVDLLGYGLEPTPELEAECERIQRDRVERARAIVDCVEERLGLALDVEFHPGVGRPHIARAIERSDAPLDFQDAFAEVIGDDGPCFVAREIPSFETGVELLTEACAIVGLAHPFRYDDPDRALELTAELDAVELVYPYGDDPDLAPVEQAIKQHDLLATGGSDAHGETLGAVGLDRPAYERVRERLPRPTRG